jgi:hypothetical protein
MHLQLRMLQACGCTHHQVPTRHNMPHHLHMFTPSQGLTAYDSSAVLLLADGHRRTGGGLFTVRMQGLVTPPRCTVHHPCPSLQTGELPLL